MDRRHQMLHSMVRAHTRLLERKAPQALLEGLLSDLVRLSESSGGFVGEIQQARDGNTRFSARAIENVHWAPRSRWIKGASGGDTDPMTAVIADVLRSRRFSIANAARYGDQRSPAEPAHARLMGLPLFCDQTLVGVACVVDRPTGYNGELADFLEPLCMTCGGVIQKHTTLRGRERVEQRLREDEGGYQAILHSVEDGIFNVDADGAIMWVNPSLETLFGYAPGELIGQEVSALMEPPAQCGADGLARKEATSARIELQEMGRETLGRKKDGTLFPIELSVAEYKVGAERLFAGVVRDISGRQEVDRLKSEFVSTVSHELRTPLASIRGSLGLLEGGVVGELPAQAHDMVRLARSNTDRLIRLINDILDLDKLEAHALPLDLREVDLAALAKSTIADMQGIAAQSGVELRFQDSTLPPARADRDRIIQALTNLLANAINHSPDNGVVLVSLEPAPRNRVRVSVSDQGCGIPSDETPRVFDRFYQLDGSDSRPKGGTGLGLAITKTIIKQHGGEVGVQSKLGAGSQFFFELSLTKPSAPKQATVSADAPCPTIMVVEDDLQVVALLERFVAAQGFRAVTAHSLAEAYRVLEACRPDVLLIDVSLPDGSGLDLAKDPPRKLSGRPIPVVVLSGRAEEKIGPNFPHLVDWICKPFKPLHLAWALRRALRAPGEGKLIALIADGDPSVRRVVHTQLRTLGIQCIEAADGSQALQLARLHRPDLLVLEVLLPERDGFQIVEALRNDMAYRTPLIVYTESDLTPQDLARLELGPTQHLQKGRTTQEQLLRTVRQVLSDLLEAEQGHPQSAGDEHQARVHYNHEDSATQQQLSMAGRECRQPSTPTAPPQGRRAL